MGLKGRLFCCCFNGLQWTGNVTGSMFTLLIVLCCTKVASVRNVFNFSWLNYFTAPKRLCVFFFLTITLWQHICTFGAFRFVSYWPLSCEWFYGSSVVLCFHKGKSYINLLPCPQRGQSPRSATDQLAWSWIGVCVLLIDTSAGHLKFRQEKKSTLKCFLWWLYVKMCLEHRSALWKL